LLIISYLTHDYLLFLLSPRSSSAEIFKVFNILKRISMVKFCSPFSIR